MKTWYESLNVTRLSSSLVPSNSLKDVKEHPHRYKFTPFFGLVDYLGKNNTLFSSELRRVSLAIGLSLFQTWRTKFIEKEPFRAYFSLFHALDLNMKNILIVPYVFVMLAKT